MRRFKGCYNNERDDKTFRHHQEISHIMNPQDDDFYDKYAGPELGCYCRYCRPFWERRQQEDNEAMQQEIKATQRRAQRRIKQAQRRLDRLERMLHEYMIPDVYNIVVDFLL